MKPSVLRFKNNPLRLPAMRFSWRLIALSIVFSFTTLIQPLISTSTALNMTTAGLVVGSYNVLHCFDKGGKSYKTRMKSAAANIQSLGFDVVGLQEHNWEDCRGDLLSALNSTGDVWKESTQVKKYGMDQVTIVWNSSVVTMTSQEIVDIDTPSNTKPEYHKGHSASVNGGTRFAHVVHFTDRSGRAFIVANVHLATKSEETAANHRKMEIKNLMNKLKSETVPVIITGDMNAATGNNKKAKRSQWKAFYDTVAEYGYGVAHDDAAIKQNESIASIGNSKKSANTIDQIFYKNVSAPSYYETFDCVSQGDGLGSCASDHHPVKAVFNDLSGSGGNMNCVTTTNTDPLSLNRTNADKALNNMLYTSGGVVCCNSGTGSSSLIGDTNAEKAYNFLITTPISTNNSRPLSQAQAAGAVGNFMSESGGHTYDLKPDYTSPYGIVQWLGTRWTNPKAKTITGLKEFAASKDTDWKDLKIQLEFVVYELENAESAVVKDSAFQSATNDVSGVQKAAERWDTLYERSGGGGVSKRKDNATRVFNDFAGIDSPSNNNDEVIDEDDEDDDELDTDVSTLSSTTNQTGCSTSAGDYVFPLQGTKSQVRTWGNDPGTTEWKSGRYHESVFEGYYAVDIFAPEGTPVLAFRAGKVIGTPHIDSMGALSIQIIDSEGYTYYYQHLSQSRGAQVKDKDTVEAGTVIAYVGNSTEAWGTAPHLHIDKSKNPGEGGRGTCTASKNFCPIAKEHRFAEIVTELRDSYEKLSDVSASSL